MTTRIRLLVFVGIFGPVVALADGPTHSESDANRPPAGNGVPSENYGKKDLLPGEEVRTPTGKTIKVWTTEGPIPVSPAPEPFAKPQPDVDSVGVVIDGRRPHLEPRVPSDSFDVGAPRTPDAPRVPPGAYPNVGTRR
ncbi:MAG: hypothetical protein IT290_04350 [Deltaproteobacteria bacterium]|nr:hypothetical protein [Deltaproteobacteria bacterium]